MAPARKSKWPWLALLLVGAALLLSTAPRPFQSSLEQGRAGEAALAGDPAAAAEHYANAARLLPYRHDLWERAGHWALQSGDPRQAIEYLERAGGGLSTQGLTSLGDAYKEIGDLSQAIQSWQAALAAGGPAADLYRRTWQACYAQGDYASATEALLKLEEIETQDGQTQYQLGLLLAAQQPQQAVKHLELAASLEPELAAKANQLRSEILAASLTDDPAYGLLMAGRALASLEIWPLAIEALTQATKANPNYAEAWAYLGEARQHLETQAEDKPGDESIPGVGLVEIHKALELDPKSLSAHLFLSLYWSRRERFDLAEQAIAAAIQDYPQEAILYVELGRVRASAGDLTGAYNAYVKATEIQPQSAAFQRYLAEFALNYSYQIGAVALPAARQVVLLSPNDAPALDLMAQVLIRLGDLANAERYLRQALQIDANYVYAHLHLGTIYLLRAETQAALDELHLVQELSPDSPAAEQAGRLIEGMLK
jgi:Tfp pilus assembly protein PilF